jgi:hypothetical protein
MDALTNSVKKPYVGQTINVKKNRPGGMLSMQKQWVFWQNSEFLLDFFEC